MGTTEAITKNGRPSTTGKSYTSIQIIKAEVENLIRSHFSGTLGNINDITNLVLACIYQESRFNPAANSGLHSESHFQRFKKYPPIAAAFSSNKTTELEKVNMRNSVAGFGLMQATGWYLIKGAGPGGRNELQRMRPDLAGPLLVAPGVDINTVLGPSNVTNQILAGLIILEAKYKGVKSKSNISSIFADYFGRGFDKGGMDPATYAAAIVQGTSYKIATSGYALTGANKGTLAAGPAKTVASGTNPDTVGCCKTA